MVASRMLVQIFLESYGTVAAVSAPLVMHVSSSSYHIQTRCGTVVALSAPLVMPLCDSHIPINVPFTFRDTSLEQRRRRCRLLVRRLVQPKLDGVRGLHRPAQSLVRRVIARIEEQGSGLQMTPPMSSEELRERL